MIFIKKLTEGSTKEKVWWGLMIVFCASFCINFIVKTSRKWEEEESRLIITTEASTPIWKIPFPAITICSETKIKQSVFNFTEYYHKMREENITEEEIFDYASASLVCDSHVYEDGNETTTEEAIEKITEFAPKFEEMFVFCKWNRHVVKCSEFFSPIMTDEGLCYTFKGNITGNGAETGLTVILRSFNEDYDFICRGPVQGFKISIHSADDIPRPGSQYIRVPLKQAVNIAIKPEYVYVDNRRSVCENDRELQYFKPYTQSNCELEQLYKIMMDECNCVPFYMSRNDSTPICSSGSSACITKIPSTLGEFKAALLTEDPSYDQNMIKKYVDDFDCPPDCNKQTLSYDTEIFQADYDWENVIIAYNEDPSEIGESELSRVSLYYKEPQFISYESDYVEQPHGTIDFLAYVGGFSALCLGFSLFNLIEIVYYLIEKGCSMVPARKKARTAV